MLLKGPAGQMIQNDQVDEAKMLEIPLWPPSSSPAQLIL